jgi:hypothetical protein
MPVKLMSSSGFAFRNVSSLLAKGTQGATAIINVRNGDENGERLGTMEVATSESKQFIFPVQANGRNFDPADGVYFEFVSGAAELTITGDDD